MTDRKTSRDEPAHSETLQKSETDTTAAGRDEWHHDGYGPARIAVAPAGRGKVFRTGTVDWLLGLKWRDRATGRVTCNVLDRHTA